MKILFVSEYFYPRVAGGEKWAYELCTELVKSGHSVTVVTSQFEKNQKKVEYISGIKFVRFTQASSLNSLIGRLSFIIKLYRYLNQLLQQEKFDAIHSMAYAANIPASRIAKKYSIKSITSVHSYFGYHWFYITNPVSACINAFLEKIVLAMDASTKIHVPSHYLAHRLWFLSKKRKVVIHNAVSSVIIRKQSKAVFCKNYSISKHEKLFVAVGNLQKIKNFDGLINFISKLSYPYKLFIVGEGSERKSLEKLIRKKGLESKIFLLGSLSRPETLQLMAQSDAILVSSHTESFSYVMAEGLQLKVPVISLNKVGLAYDYPQYFILFLSDTLQPLQKFSKLNLCTISGMASSFMALYISILDKVKIR